MATHGTKNAKQHTSFEWKTVTSFSGGVNLITQRPGYNNAQSAGLLPRGLYFPAAGNIVLVMSDDTSDTMTVTAGATVPCSPKSITESGTTISGVTVLW